MSQPADEASSWRRLLRFGVGALKCAAPARQIAAVLEPGARLDGERPLWLHQLLGFTGEVHYETPVIFVLAFFQPRKLLVVDSLEDIIEVGATGIRPLPSHLASWARLHGFLGLIPATMCFIMDFRLFFGGPPARSSPPHN